ncbi:MULTISPECIES: substrate-binding periplasmic protein [unclassified Burkholderia]|uniref:substrate-binding periplasmic protein n=1 Tax=unclassified Burkholderia TaxID=2613784 RepID=UPI00214FF581|nr:MULTISPECIES: transporter substrate-binding domain-containing protein [unclassified Burkholderia]MCR4471577.1 transporter substrate-binding domain-containing protein [Burkholderia sp. SCN-KJ]
MRKSKEYVVSLTIIASSIIGMNAAVAECVPAHQFKTVVPGILTISTAEFPPFDVPGSGGSLSGVEGDILKKIAEKECLKINALPVGFGSAIQYVTTGKVDISAAQWYRTADRVKVVGMSDPLYLDQLAIYSKEGYTTFDQLKGKQVGTIQGYNWTADLQALFKDNLKLYPTPVAMAQDLQAGRLDAALDSIATGLYAQKKGGYPGMKILVGSGDPRVRASVKPAQVGFVYSKGNAALSAALNADIDDMQKTKDIARIMQAYGLDPKSADVGPSRFIQ